MDGDRSARRRDRGAAADFPDVELVTVAPVADELEPLPPRTPIPRSWWVAAAVAAAVLVALIGYQSRHRNGAAPPAPRPSSSTSIAVSPSSPISSALPLPAGAVTVTRLGHAVVPAATGTDLFARGPGALLRVELASGRITRTPVPLLSSDGPVSFLVGSDRAIIRPLDFVPGYVVHDGRPARTLDDLAFSSGQAVSGPDADHAWVPTLDGSRMRLVDLDGRPSGPVLQVPTFGSRPDGAGYLAYADTSGVYDARPDGSRRITTGDLLAVGPTGWLVSECDALHRCHTFFVDRSLSHRRTVGVRRAQPNGTGAICADGSTAALFETTNGSTSRLTLLDLRSGQARTVPIAVDLDHVPDLVWSPDGRYLFTVDANGRIVVVDRTGQVRRLPASLPPVTQLAVRVPGH